MFNFGADKRFASLYLLLPVDEIFRNLRDAANPTIVAVIDGGKMFIFGYFFSFLYANIAGISINDSSSARIRLEAIVMS